MNNERHPSTGNTPVIPNSENQPTLGGVPYDQLSLQEAIDRGLVVPKVTTSEIPVVEAPLADGRAPAQELPPAYTPQPLETFTRPEKKPSHGKKIAAAIAGLAVAVGGFAAVKAGSSDKSGPTPATTPTAEAPVVPGPVETPASAEPTPEETPTDSPEKPVESDTEILKQTVSFEAMDAMDIEQFAALDYADRVGYAYGLLTSQQDDEGLSQIFSAFQELAFDPYSTGPTFWETSMGWSLSQADPVQGAKLVSVSDYYTHKKDGTITENYSDLSNTLINLQTPEGSLEDTIFYDVKQSGETQQGTDSYGNPITFTNISYEPLNSRTSEAIGGIRTAQVIHAKTQLLDGTTVSTYPSGLGIDGVESPAKDYPY